MKPIIMTVALLALGACSLLGDKPDSPSVPVVREQFNSCPYLQADGTNHPRCPKGDPKGKGICMPSGELHSSPDKCDKVK